MDLEGKIRPLLPIEIGGFHVNYVTVFNSAVVVVAAALLVYGLTKRVGKYPGRGQVAAEFLVGAFDGIVRQAMGKRLGRLFLPVFGTLFIYMLLSNVMGIVPLSALTWGAFPEEGLEISSEPLVVDLNGNGIWDPGEPFEDANGNGIRDAFFIPPLEEPTKDINMPLGMALWLAALMYFSMVVLRGPLHILKDLADPVWFMFPMNLVGKVADVVSVSFRLFGNIFGGSVIIIVVGGLLRQFVLPIGLWAFLGLFVGIVQALVYTMLWITYTAIALGDGGE